MNNKIISEKTKRVLAFLAESLVHGLASYQADIQSKQMAEISALKHAKSTGTGYAGYQKAMRNYKNSYRPSPVQPMYYNQRNYKTSDLNHKELNTLINLYSGKAENARQSSEKCSNILKCYDKNLSKDDLAVCIEKHN